MVGHLADVAHHLLVARGGRNGHLVEQVGGGAGIVVESEVDAAVELKLQSGIELAGALPLQFRIADSLIIARQGSCAIGIVGIAGALHELRERQVVAYFLIAGHAPRGTHLQVGDGVIILEEVLVADPPAEAHRGEGTELVVIAEARRAVEADGGCEQVLVGIVVGSTCCPRDDAVAIVVAAGRKGLRQHAAEVEGLEQHVVELAAHCRSVVLVVLPGIDARQRQVVLVPLVGVGDDVIHELRAAACPEV